MCALKSQTWGIFMSLEKHFDALIPEIRVLCFTIKLNAFMLHPVFHVAAVPEHGVHIT